MRREGSGLAFGRGGRGWGGRVAGREGRGGRITNVTKRKVATCHGRGRV